MVTNLAPVTPQAPSLVFPIVSERYHWVAGVCSKTRAPWHVLVWAMSCGGCDSDADDDDDDYDSDTSDDD